MTRLSALFLFLLCLLPLGAAAQKYHYEQVEGDPMHARIYTLDNGLKIYLSVNKERPRVQTYIAVRTGSRNDPPETTGLAHYLEHIMFKGTTHFGTSNMAAEQPLLDDIEARFEQYRHITDSAARRQAYHEIDSVSQLAARYFIPNEYDKLMSSIGAEGSNAYTSNDVTCYTENIPSNEIDTWARIEADRFKNMVIRGFHTELEAVYEEYNIGLAQDNRKIWSALYRLLYPTHPYGLQTTIGTQEHLKNPSITNIKAYFHKYYVPNNVAICMAGDFDPDQVVATIDKYFGDWKKSDNLTIPQYAPVRTLTAPVDTTVNGLEAAAIWLGWKADGYNSLQTDTLDLIGDILYNGTAGLFDLDLNAPMKVQNAGSGLSTNHDYSTFLMFGQPKQGQSLEETKLLMIGEIEKLKQGKFSDDLLPAIINNKRLNYYRSLLSNQRVADDFVDAFINDAPWDFEVHRIDRQAKITKQQIVDFANRFFQDNYAAVYKHQAIDTTLHKIDKPIITPIPTNNNMQSDFLKEIVNLKPTPIQPRFVDFKHDLTVGKTHGGLEYLYKQNTTDKLFNLTLRYPFGTEADKRYTIAAYYIDYVGTDKLSNEQIKQQFYKLACNYSINVADDHIDFNLSGLNDNMPQALALVEDILNNAKADPESYSKFVDLTLKGRADDKADQRSNFNVLRAYGQNGEWNAQRNRMSEQELRTADPQQLLDLLKNIKQYPHTVMYFGPTSKKDFDQLFTKTHNAPKSFLPVPKGKPYLAQPTPQNEVWIAPYDAKNIYMVMYHNDGTKWTPEHAPVISLFNEYFGGGMNAIVFQEMREARGLAYSAGASYMRPSVHPYTDTERFYTYVISQNDKMMDCIDEFHNLLDSMPERQAGFDLAKQSLTKSLATQRTTRANVFFSYLAAKKLGLKCTLNQQIYEALPALQLKDVIDFAHSHVANKPYRYLILGDEKNLDMKALEKIGPIRRLTTEEIFGD